MNFKNICKFKPVIFGSLLFVTFWEFIFILIFLSFLSFFLFNFFRIFFFEFLKFRLLKIWKIQKFEKATELLTNIREVAGTGIGRSKEVTYGQN